MHFKNWFYCSFLILFFACSEQENNASKKIDTVELASKKEKKESGKELFDNNYVHEIHISFPQEYWEDSLLLNKKFKDSTYISRYLQCKAIVDGNSYYSCGLRYKGESSYQFYPSKKKSFRLKFAEFIKKQKHDGIKGISLNNNFKDPSMIREKLILETYGKNQLPAQRASFAKVYLEGEYYGLYTILESIDKSFKKRHYGTSKGVFVQGKPRAHLSYLKEDTLAYKHSYTMKKKEENLKHIINLTRAIEEDDDLEEHINLKEVYKHFAINNFFVNIDAYNMYFKHNYFLYKPNLNKPFEWINYDFNYSFGAWAPDLTLKQMEELSPYFKREGKDFPLWDLILSNDEYKQAYTKAYLKILNEFNLNDFKKSVLYYEDLLAKPVSLDSLKMYSTKDFHTNMKTVIGDELDPGAFSPGLVDFITKRKEYLLQVLQGEIQ